MAFIFDSMDVGVFHLIPTLFLRIVLLLFFPYLSHSRIKKGCYCLIWKIKVECILDLKKGFRCSLGAIFLDGMEFLGIHGEMGSKELLKRSSVEDIS